MPTSGQIWSWYVPDALRDISSAGRTADTPGTQSQNALAVEEGEQVQAQLNRAPSTINNRLEDVSARDRQVSQIAQSISELAELFEQLSALVIEQGALVDRIDWNVETSSENVQLAQRHLVAAQGHQRRSGRVQCIILLFLCAMLLVTIIIVKPFFRWFRWTSPKPAIPSPPSSPLALAL